MNAKQVISDPKKKICLKPVDISDLDFFYQIYGDREIMQYIGKPVTFAQAQKQLRETIKTMNSALPDHHTYVIIDMKSGSNVGITGINWLQRNKRDIAELGVMIVPKWRRQRMAHTAKSMLIEYGFNVLKLNRLLAHSQVQNVAANQANIQLNFQRGTVKRSKTNQNLIQEWYIERSMWNVS